MRLGVPSFEAKQGLFFALAIGVDTQVGWLLSLVSALICAAKGVLCDSKSPMFLPANILDFPVMKAGRRVAAKLTPVPSIWASVSNWQVNFERYRTGSQECD